MQLLEPRLLCSTDQFIAKLYAWALGRAPDQDGFVSYESQVPRIIAHDIYSSAEFNALDYPRPEQIETLYRGILNREPDEGGFNYWLNSGYSVTAMVDSFFASAEMKSLSLIGSYGFDGAWPLGPYSDVNQLQATLLSAAPGSVVLLPQYAIYIVTGILYVPATVMIASIGVTSTNHYASMARIIRGSNFNGPVVECHGALEGVWIDGQSGILGTSIQSSEADLFAFGASITDCLFTGQVGPTSVSLGTQFDHPAGDVFLRNLITQWTPAHDGIQVYDPSALVQGNSVVDASDAAYALFSDADVAQKSRITGNIACNFGNRGTVSFVASPVRPNGTGDMNGASIDSNTGWVGQGTSIDIGLAMGAYEWTASDSSTLLVGCSFAANVIGMGRFGYAYIADGMEGITFVANIGGPLYAANATFAYTDTIPIPFPASTFSF